MALRRCSLLLQPFSFFQLAFILAVNTPFLAHARLITVEAKDRTAITYTPELHAWLGPVTYDPKTGQPNSTVCEFAESSIYTLGDGNSLSFTFVGTSIQLIMASKPNHGRFSVILDDGEEVEGDTFSIDPACGVAWSQSDLSLRTHTIRMIAHPVSGQRPYVEVMKLIYDDGTHGPSGVDSTGPPVISQSPPPSSSTALSQTKSETTLQSSRGNIIATERSASTMASIGKASLMSRSTAGIPSSSSLHSPEESSAQTVPSDAQSNQSGPGVPFIVGITVSAVCALVLLCTGVYALWRRRIRRARPTMYPMSLGHATTTTQLSPLSLSSISKDEKFSTTRSDAMSVPQMSEVTSRITLPFEDIDRIALRVHDILNASGDRGALPSYSTSYATSSEV